MKHSVFISIITTTLLLFLVIFGYEENDLPSDPGTSTTELLSKKATSPPTLDGSVDDSWLECQMLTTEAIVPSVEFDNFKGYEGNTYKVAMRSMYDDTHIYFLAEWEDSRLDVSRQTWYFDTGDKRWKQESRYPTFDTEGNKIREPFYEVG